MKSHSYSIFDFYMVKTLYLEMLFNWLSLLRKMICQDTKFLMQYTIVTNIFFSLENIFQTKKNFHFMIGINDFSMKIKYIAF